MKIFSPLTLFQEGQELKVSFYQLPEPKHTEYQKGAIAYNEAHQLWQASKTTLSVHKETGFITVIYDADLYKHVSDLEKGIDISSLLPRLEVKTLCCRGFGEYGECDRQCNSDGMNVIVLKPEQPVNEVESQDELWSEMTLLLAKYYQECVSGIMDPKQAQELLKSKFEIKRK